MFQELRDRITAENIQKIKQQQKYQLESQQEDDDYSIGDYELEERQENFKVLMQDQNYILQQKDYATPTKLRKIQKQLELTIQKNKIMENTHRKYIDILQQNHQTEIITYQTEIDKYILQIRKFQKDTKIINCLRAENVSLVRLKEQLQDQYEDLTQQNTNLQTINNNLQQEIQNYQQKDKEQQNKSTNQQKGKLESIISNLEKDSTLLQQKIKMLQTNKKNSQKEIRELRRVMEQKQSEHSQAITDIYSKNEKTMQKLQNQNRQVMSRVKYLEESLIDHLSQASQFIYHNQSKRKTHEQQGVGRFESTINLQDQSPFRTDKKPTKQIISISQQDPQKIQPKKCTTFEQKHGKCVIKQQKLRLKLEQANNKIVQLLRQKCQPRKKIQSFY